MLRLLRDDWKGENGTKMLSEELYAIMASAVAEGKQTGQLNLQQPAPGVYPLVINTGDNGNGIQIKGPKGTATIGLGGINFSQAPTGQPVVGAGGGIPGRIVSGGPGDTYTVSLYENGLAGGVTATVPVKQLQIDPAETIPVGTWTLVSKIGSGYVMQVPVWVA
jgi:hypothetical protein